MYFNFPQDLPWPLPHGISASWLKHWLKVGQLFLGFLLQGVNQKSVNIVKANLFLECIDTE